MNKRILMIVTSNARMGTSGPATGLWAEELAVPYFSLVDAGVEVVLASPVGGAAPIDPASLKPRGGNSPAVERMLADATLMDRIAHTAPVADLAPQDFDAVFLPGGHGTMWDLPTDPGVIRAVEITYEAGRPVASVCHGVAGLLGARRADGRPIVEGRRVNAFTDAEERAAGLDTVVPFLLESRLREQGAHFECTANWQPFVVENGPLITGQNPQSSGRVVRALLSALGLSHQASD